jgi:hypothetical protein
MQLTSFVLILIPMTMRTKFLSLLTGLMLLSLTNTDAALAKRLPAPIAQPAVANGIKYIAPNKIGTKGIIQAWNIKTGKKLWQKTLYTVRLNPKLETDVQWLYIQSIQIKGNQIIATNEQNQRYSINLKTLQSKHLNP